MTLLAETITAVGSTRSIAQEHARKPVARHSLRGARPKNVAGAPTDGATLALRAVGDIPGMQAIRPNGRSMNDAFVGERDVVLVQPAADIRNGELVAVRCSPLGPVVLRRITFEGDHAILRPEDRRYHPLVLPRSRIDICGRVVAIVRSSPRPT